LSRWITFVVSLVDGSNLERTRTPRPTFSVVAPSDPSNALTRSVSQESLPEVAGKAQVGTTGGVAAALPGKAIKPTPRAAAEAKSNAMRFLVLMYGSPPCAGQLPTTPLSLPGNYP
jgi:hypothetical protein